MSHTELVEFRRMLFAWLTHAGFELRPTGDGTTDTHLVYNPTTGTATAVVEIRQPDETNE